MPITNPSVPPFNKQCHESGKKVEKALDTKFFLPTLKEHEKKVNFLNLQIRYSSIEKSLHKYENNSITEIIGSSIRTVP